ncbi:hypothetical protein O6H91_06G074800 [Diphasiastrum complanatum]|uniref:Uncharacterized protein n=1 Tax=Diphasiastrum complanatum TaxID=34168 RepID=A0ACC2DFD1_DIPCM|nr:hypothetical protein O6H91_06G074800 [Diphasiastrum complanatum]
MMLTNMSKGKCLLREGRSVVRALSLELSSFQCHAHGIYDKRCYKQSSNIWPFCYGIVFQSYEKCTRPPQSRPFWILMGSELMRFDPLSNMRTNVFLMNTSIIFTKTFYQKDKKIIMRSFNKARQICSSMAYK